MVNLHEMPHLIDLDKKKNLIYDRGKSEKIGNYDKEHEVQHHQDLVGNEIYSLKHKKSGEVHLHMGGLKRRDGSVQVRSLKGSPNSKVKAHEFYHHLIHKHGLTLHSDRIQSEGGKKTWEKLSKYPDIDMDHKDADTHKKIPFDKDNFSNNYNKKSYFTAKKRVNEEKEMKEKNIEKVKESESELLDSTRSTGLSSYPHKVIRVVKEETEFEEGGVLTISVPLFIRMLEYAREDAPDDMALHRVTEKMMKLMDTGEDEMTLDMDDYKKIVSLTEAARYRIVKARIKYGKVQRQKRVSNVKGYAFRKVGHEGMQLVRMSPMELRNRKMGQRTAKLKRRMKLAAIKLKMKRSIRRRRSMEWGHRNYVNPKVTPVHHGERVAKHPNIHYAAPQKAPHHPTEHIPHTH